LVDKLSEKLDSLNTLFNKNNIFKKEKFIVPEQREFIQEAGKFKNFLKTKMNVEGEIIPLYEDTVKVNNILKNITSSDDVAIFGSYGSEFAGISNNW